MTTKPSNEMTDTQKRTHYAYKLLGKAVPPDGFIPEYQVVSAEIENNIFFWALSERASKDMLWKEAPMVAQGKADGQSAVRAAATRALTSERFPEYDDPGWAKELGLLIEFFFAEPPEKTGRFEYTQIWR